MPDIYERFKNINHQLLNYNLPEISMGQFLIIFGRVGEPSEDKKRKKENIELIKRRLGGIENDG